jgi:hypothetical protein
MLSSVHRLLQRLFLPLLLLMLLLLLLLLLQANESPLKRASSFVRIGRHQHPSSTTLSSPLSPSLRKSDDLSRKRMSSFVRIGKRLSSYDSADEPSNAGDEVVEIGKSSSVLSGGCDGSGDRCKIVSDVDFGSRTARPAAGEEGKLVHHESDAARRRRVKNQVTPCHRRNRAIERMADILDNNLSTFLY